MANTLKFGNGQWATGNGTALAYNDENANFKPLPFDFTRASSGTTVNQSGLIETVGSGIPRIDFQDNAKGALLLEPSRTNLTLYSEDFSNSWWNKQTFGTGVEASVITTTELAPDGSTNAFLVTLNSGSGTTTSDQARVDKNIVGLSSGLDYTESIYLKGVNGGEQVLLGVSNIGTIKVTLTTEWKRFILSGTSGGAFNGVGPIIRRGLQEPLNSYAQFYMWGSQLEQGSYATSYIPTSGSAVTRVLENITQTTPNLSNSQEVTAFIDLGARPLTGSNSTSDAIEFYFASNNRIIYNQNGSSKHRIEINTDGNSTRNYFSTTTFSTTPIKIAIAVTQSTLKIYTNRGDSWNVPIQGVADWSNLSIVKTNIVQSIGNIKINDLKFYNTALTDQELIALTQV
jgi:hypothetical protein